MSTLGDQIEQAAVDARAADARLWQLIEQARRQGTSCRAIAERAGMSHETIRRRLPGRRDHLSQEAG